MAFKLIPSKPFTFSINTWIGVTRIETNFTECPSKIFLAFAYMLSWIRVIGPLCTMAAILTLTGGDRHLEMKENIHLLVCNNICNVHEQFRPWRVFDVACYPAGAAAGYCILLVSSFFTLSEYPTGSCILLVILPAQPQDLVFFSFLLSSFFLS